MNLMFCQLVAGRHCFCVFVAAELRFGFLCCGHVHLLVFDLCLTVVVSHHFVVFSSLQIFLVSSFQQFSVTLSSRYISLQLFFSLFVASCWKFFTSCCRFMSFFKIHFTCFVMLHVSVFWLGGETVFFSFLFFFFYIFVYLLVFFKGIFSPFLFYLFIFLGFMQFLCSYLQFLLSISLEPSHFFFSLQSLYLSYIILLECLHICAIIVCLSVVFFVFAVVLCHSVSRCRHCVLLCGLFLKQFSLPDVFIVF